MGQSRETAGFLFRWCLLAAAGAMTATAAMAGLVATVAILDDVRADFAMADQVTRWPPVDHKGVSLRGAIAPPVEGGPTEVLFAVPEGQPVDLLWTHRAVAVVDLLPDRPGRLNIAVRGLPYTNLAFRHDRACLLSLGDDRAVFLVDARLARSAGRDRPGPWRACLSQMAERAQVLLFHPGRPADFLRCRRELRDMGVAEPVLFGSSPGDPAWVLALAARDLARRPARMGVLTDDADLARRAAALGFPTHLLGSLPGKTKLPPNLKLHGSLDEFRDSPLDR